MSTKLGEVHLDKIEGWLAFFIVVILVSSLVSFYNFHVLSKQDFIDSFANLMEPGFIFIGILLLVGFFLLIGKVPIARFYILLVLGIYIIALISLIAKEPYIIESDSVFFALFKSLILFGYFLRSRRVKVVYRYEYD